jgi:hypothetical protein
MENKYKIKICKGCDHLSIVPLPKTAIACCPDSNYVDVEFCKPNERKFLDEIKEKAKLIRPNVYAIFPEPLKLRSVIFAKDFEANLSELLEL